MTHIHKECSLRELRAGDLVSVTPCVMGFVCWVDFPDGENSFSHGLGYLGTDGEYHERTVKDTDFTVWLVHPMIGRCRRVEERAMGWATP